MSPEIAGQLFNKLIPTQQFELKKKIELSYLSVLEGQTLGELIWVCYSGLQKAQKKVFVGLYFSLSILVGKDTSADSSDCWQIHFPVFVGVNTLLAGFQMEAFLSY